MADVASLRDRLIDVGVDLVLTEGSASVGLREIARRAGVSHGAPRRHFPTHQALLSAIARRGFEDLGARFNSALAGLSTPRGRVKAVALAYVGYAVECRGMFELMFRHDLLDGAQQSAGLPRLRTSTLPHFDHLVSLVEQCREEAGTEGSPGESNGPALPARIVAAALWSNLHGIALLWGWGSLQLALDAPPPGGERSVGLADDLLDQLITAALNAHLGPQGS